ncbi:hypothetical protein E1200_24325 [Actinomadura sp. GC306]|nr:hypothetical protein E1200_24325 [Actinomadura sp. GC306]
MKPVFVGLGTAAILAAGGASAVAAADTPSPSPSDSVAQGELSVIVSTAPEKPKAGETVDVTATIKATGGPVAAVRIKGLTTTPEAATLTGACKDFDSEACSAGDLTDGEDAVFAWDLKAPEKTEKVEITVTVGAAELKDITGPASVAFLLPSPTPTPTETSKPPSSSKPPAKKPTGTPSKKPKPSDSASGGDGGSSGGSGGSSAGGSGSGSGSGSAGGAVISRGGVVPPQPNSSFAPPDPSVALPPIEPPSPSVAPSQGAPVTPQSRLQGNEAPVAQDLTFERMASTQAAWLAALLVAFSLLMTQLRLGRRPVPAGAAAKRAKGAHRRPRKGVFGK